MNIYDDIFGDYFIKVVGVRHYKVFKKRKCVKLDVYKDIDSKVEELNDSDYNTYEIKVSTHNSLRDSIVYIYEHNTIYRKGINRIRLFELLKTLHEFTRICQI